MPTCAALPVTGIEAGTPITVEQEEKMALVFVQIQPVVPLLQVALPAPIVLQHLFRISRFRPMPSSATLPISTAPVSNYGALIGGSINPRRHMAWLPIMRATF